MAPKRLRNVDDSTFVVAEDAPPFQWDVHHNESGYTIRIHNQPLYIVTRDTDVLIADKPQYFQIRPKTAGSEEVYFEIQAADNRLFQYNGGALSPNSNAKVPGEVTAEKNATSSLWAFQELSDDLPTPTPYSIYPKNSDYFEYSADHGLLPRFGLKDDSADRWPKFWHTIRRLNAEARGSVIYKVIFFARHGTGFHNLRLDTAQKDSLKDDGDLLRDAQLVQNGLFQVSRVQHMWTHENSLDDGGIGIPPISYCSPLTRCLATNSITFTPWLAVKGGPKINTVVVEDCREIVYKDEAEKRRSKSYIELVYPKLAIEKDFAEEDPYWTGNGTESPESVKRRVQAVLDRIFKSEAKEKIFVSMTAHHEIVGAFISALGGSPGAYPLHTGGVVPIICQYTPSPGPLDDGFYKIQFVPDPSLFADAHEQVVVASEKTPTTWFVKCIDAKEQAYTIQYFRMQLHGMPKPKLYWNTKNTTVTTQSSDVPVILSEKHGWRLVPASEVGVYYIEWVDLPPNTTTGSNGVTLVTVKSSLSRNSSGKPVILKNGASIGSGAPSWRFIPLMFPWGFGDVLN